MLESPKPFVDISLEDRFSGSNPSPLSLIYSSMAPSIFRSRKCTESAFASFADIIHSLLGNSKNDLKMIRHLLFPDGNHWFNLDASVNRLKSPAEPGKGGYNTQIVQKRRPQIGLNSAGLSNRFLDDGDEGLQGFGNIQGLSYLGRCCKASSALNLMALRDDPRTS